MMKKYFNINFEFNHVELENIILKTSLKSKGYCCFVDSTSLVYSYKNEYFKTILNSSLVNSCDGSYIAILAGIIHKEQLREYIGPDFFKKFIYRPYTQLVIGNTEAVFNKIKLKLELNKSNTSNIFFISLPFKNSNEFDYLTIAKQINRKNPQLIWVSLGAPKQEEFMFNLLPYLDSGVMLGVGAALNYFTGEIDDIPVWIKKLHMIWIYRIFTEPKKQLIRLKSIIFTFPVLLYKEIYNIINVNITPSR